MSVAEKAPHDQILYSAEKIQDNIPLYSADKLL